MLPIVAAPMDKKFVKISWKSKESHHQIVFKVLTMELNWLRSLSIQMISRAAIFVAIKLPHFLEPFKNMPPPKNSSPLQDNTIPLPK